MSRIAAPILLSLFLIIFFIASPASATTVTIGDIFSEKDVNVSIMINDVEDVGSATIKVYYDSSVIIVTHIDEKSEFDSFTPNIYCAQDGWVKMTAYQSVSSGLSGNVTFANLTITPRGSYGEISNLTMALETLADRDRKIINDAEVIDGFFYIGMNGDVSAEYRKIDNDDSLYIAKGIAGIEELKVGASEVSGDGIVDAYDCVYLARHAAGIPGYDELR